MDPRDRLICALSCLLRAEREAREALEEAIRADSLGSDVQAALAGKPRTPVSSDDIELAEEFAYPFGGMPH